MGESENASMDQVRDLLFGSQVRQIEDRLKRQEEAAEARISAIANESRESLERLQASFENKLRDEEKKRGDDMAAADAKIAQVRNELENRAKHLSDALSKAESSLSALMADMSDQFIAALGDRFAIASKSLEELARTLRGELVAKEGLSKLFADLAESVADREIKAENGRKKGKADDREGVQPQQEGAENQ